MTIDIDLSGLEPITRALGAAPKQAEKVVHRSGVTALAGMKRGAQAAAPRRSGWLATAGIRTRSWPGHYDLYTADDDDGQNPGFHVEFGTSSQPPRPFIQPQLAPGAAAMAALIIEGVDPLESA